MRSQEATQLFDLCEELDLGDAPEHFKSAYTGQIRVVVANNTYNEQEFLDQRQAGRLAELGRLVLDHRGAESLCRGRWKRRQSVLRWRSCLCDSVDQVEGGAAGPREWAVAAVSALKSSQSWDHAWNTEWMRIRHAVTERLLMDVQGTFFELPPFAYGGRIWGIRPISTHLRVVPDFCSWRGFLVMASDQIDHDQGRPQSGLWFGNIDDLWGMGKPTGWGGPWWRTPVRANTVSDPFLMTGYDKKVIHLAHDSKESIRFDIEVDFLGDGHWTPYVSVDITSKTGYMHHEFPDGFSAHWVRVRVKADCNATADFVYS